MNRKRSQKPAHRRVNAKRDKGLEENVHLAVSLVEYPSDDFDQRIGAIPLLFEDPGNSEQSFGQVVFDSWENSPPGSLRDINTGHIRCIKLKAKDLTLEVVAELGHGSWDFVARIYSRDKVAHQFILKAGGRRLMPISGGYIHWRSRNVPHALSIISHDITVNFEKLVWR